MLMCGILTWHTLLIPIAQFSPNSARARICTWCNGRAIEMADKVGGKEVLGIDDPWIIAGFIVLFGSTIACVVYGALYYNKDVDDED